MHDIFKTKINNYNIHNAPERAKTSRNQLKRAETSQNDQKTAKQPEMTQKFQNWENLEFSAKFRFWNFEPKHPYFGHLGQKVLTF